MRRSWLCSSCPTRPRQPHRGNPVAADTNTAAQRLINELNTQACAHHTDEAQRARCVTNREIEQMAGLGPLPDEPGFEACTRGELPARYCGDVQPGGALRIRVSQSQTQDYPLVAE
ncbi:MAG: hypothetical protein WDM79_16120 [Terricaulis sp.]